MSTFHDLYIVRIILYIKKIHFNAVLNKKRIGLKITEGKNLEKIVEEEEDKSCERR